MYSSLATALHLRRRVYEKTGEKKKGKQRGIFLSCVPHILFENKLPPTHSRRVHRFRRLVDTLSKK
ncbi:hypothetical protein CSUI_010979 [Cystoisospora suis]|uniref:Uncharacterized protein n=1 Tax=Cystoisospora suis TaxID=483139 RepID=A0A2C6KDB3_9APIC|nr:hypothetical protein CSUI_010979 [Cystoisospora suis]